MTGHPRADISRCLRASTDCVVGVDAIQMADLRAVSADKFSYRWIDVLSIGCLAESNSAGYSALGALLRSGVPGRPRCVLTLPNERSPLPCV